MNVPNLPPIWQEKLSAEFDQPYMFDLRKFLFTEYNEQIVYPPKSNIFRALQFTDFNDVKVCILGQDPYHGATQANGLAFAVSDSITSKPPSLRRIFDEVERDTNVKVNRSQSSLEGWAKQGVLLLNTTLTVREHTPRSHVGKGWETFTDKVISILNDREEKVIFLLWGKHAQQKVPLITNPQHVVLIAPHPSPLARGFEGCKHFSKVNELLTTPIDWSSIS